jgi:deazaflavin-dependent oxidoreductase (nitroreductase family)
VSAYKDVKRGTSRFVTRRLVNPVVRPLAMRGLLGRGTAVLETIGRKSGVPRRTPVGNGLRGNVFWIVTEHGYGADYVKNIQKDPRVRVRVGRRWYEGVATILPDDDPGERLRMLRRPLNDTMLRLAASEQLVIRVDLEA